MEFQKLLIKAAYWLVAISILVIIALTLFSSHLIKKQSKNPTTEIVTESDPFNDQVVSGEESAIEKEQNDYIDFEDVEKTYSGDLFQTE
jgi:hypothetical protein